MKNVNIMGVHQFLEEGGHKKTIYMGNCLKRGMFGPFAGGLAKSRAGVFEGRAGVGVDTSMRTMT